jgi:hypothetical protein
MNAVWQRFSPLPLTLAAWLLGSVFVVSAVAKLAALGAVELYVVQQHLLPSRTMAAYAVRLLIAAELGLGLCCLQRAGWRRFTLPATYLVCLGETNEAPPFFQDTGADFPYLCVPPEQFFAFIAEKPPRLYLLQRGQPRAFWDHESFDPQQLRTRGGHANRPARLPA